MRTESIPERDGATGNPPLPVEAPRAKWREAVAASLYHSGVLRLVQSVSRSYELRSDPTRKLPRWQRVSNPKVAILCYHRVGTGGVPLFNGLAPEMFDAQMRFLRQRYPIVSLDEVCRELENPTGTRQAVAVTFDDGYRDLYTHALPILLKYQIPATIFLTVGSIETGQTPWHDRVFLALKVFPADQLNLDLDRPRQFHLIAPAARLQAATEIVQRLRRLPDWHRRQVCTELDGQVELPQEELEGRMLTWEQIRTMQRAGITFGSHTMTHPTVSRLAPAEMERELLESKHILEQRLESPVRDFAFPFGQPADCGSLAAPLLARCGYRSAATTVWGMNTPGTNPFALRRVQIGEECRLAMFAFKLNQLFLHRAEGSDPLGPRTTAPGRGEALCDSGRLAT